MFSKFGIFQDQIVLNFMDMFFYVGNFVIYVNYMWIRLFVLNEILKRVLNGNDVK